MSSARTNPDWSDYLSLGLLSAALLALEVILLRVFSYSQWHHFASLTISLALLGFGAAGTFLAIIGKRAILWGDTLFKWAIVGAASGVLFLFFQNQNLRVRPLFAIWDSRQFILLLWLNLAAFLPFFAGAIPIGQVFVRWPAATGKLYSANLFGSGVGSIGAIGLLEIAHLPTCLFIDAAAMFLAGIVFCTGKKKSKFGAIANWIGLSIAICWPLLMSPSLYVSDFKRLSYLNDFPDAEIIQHVPDRRGTITVVRSDSIRTAWGLSLNWFEVIPSMDSLVIGTDNSIPLPRKEQAPTDFNFIKSSLSAAPYAIATTGTVAVLGTSEGWGVIQAIIQNVRAITWVELNPKIVEIGEELWARPEVEVITSSPRQFLHQTKQYFDLIVFDAALSVGDSLSEEPLLTAEGFSDALELLSEDGMIAVPFHLSNPPRHFQRLMATICTGLRQVAEEEAGQHILAMRSLQDIIIVISRQPFQDGKVGKWSAFAQEKGFDLVWAPGLRAENTNKYNQLEVPYYYQITKSIVKKEGDLPLLVQLYRNEGATDTRPYLWNSMRWQTLPELIKQLGRQGLVLLDWGMLMLAVSFCSIAILAFLLIVLPLIWISKEKTSIPKIQILLYFSALGAGYMIVEMTILQRAILISGDVVLSAAFVFGAFLIGSGIGSMYSPSARTTSAARRVFLSIGVGMMICAFIMGVSAEFLWQLRSFAQGVLTIAALFPLAIAMGQALPWGLRVMAESESRIAWAWGINGFASVLGAPLATLISVELGHYFTAITGAAIYVLAALVGLRRVKKA